MIGRSVKKHTPACCPSFMITQLRIKKVPQLPSTSKEKTIMGAFFLATVFGNIHSEPVNPPAFVSEHGV
jgi:hypothetical protein